MTAVIEYAAQLREFGAAKGFASAQIEAILAEREKWAWSGIDCGLMPRSGPSMPLCWLSYKRGKTSVYRDFIALADLPARMEAAQLDQAEWLDEWFAGMHEEG